MFDSQLTPVGLADRGAVAPPKAIETRWKHWRFRSRLEARWAVVFEALKIEFSYELEGFELPGDVRYLPDFYLPKVRMWAEVKPSEFTAEEKKKCVLLSDATSAPCLLLVGPPALRSYFAVHPVDIEGVCEPFECDYSLDIDYNKRIYYERDGRLWSQPEYPAVSSELHFSGEYRHAVVLALSARFDEGRF
jgi:hypothetical protein